MAMIKLRMQPIATRVFDSHLFLMDPSPMNA